MLSVWGVPRLKNVAVRLLSLCMLLELKRVPVSGSLKLRCAAVLSADRLLEFRQGLNLLSDLWWRSEVLKMVKVVTSATMIWRRPTRRLYLLWVFAPCELSRLLSTGVEWMEGMLCGLPMAVSVALPKVCPMSAWWYVAALLELGQTSWLHSVPNSRVPVPEQGADVTCVEVPFPMLCLLY
jgi:hypothetical protein